MDTTRDVTATFTQQFRLDLSQTGLGTVALNPLPVVADSAGGLYDIGTVVTVTATPDSGSVFTSYSGDLTGGTAVQQLKMDADKSVDALFTRRYLLSLTQLGSGTVTLSPPPVAGTVNAAFYDAGTVVTVTSTPDSGSIFFGYNGDLTGTDSLQTLTMDTDKNVTSNFNQQFVLNTAVTGFGAITLNPPGGTYLEGTVVTVTAVPDSGNRFDAFAGLSLIHI